MLEMTLDQLVAERNALLRPLQEFLTRQGLSRGAMPGRIVEICLALAAEEWAKGHPVIAAEEETAAVFGEMARAAVKGYYDAVVIMRAKRGGICA